MKELLKIAFKHNFDTILKNSYKNCHARGVHSVSFDGSKIRAFVATKNHQLFVDDNGDFPVAIHNHRFDIRLTHLSGNPINHRCYELLYNYSSRFYKVFRYQSKIMNNSGYFEELKGRQCVIGYHSESVKKYSNFISCNQLHTITVKKGEEASWLVEEGELSKDYNSICYSTKDLTKFDFDGMYEPMDKKTLIECYKIIFGENYA